MPGALLGRDVGLGPGSSGPGATGPQGDDEILLRAVSSPCMVRVLDLADRVARSPDTPVLLEGESGTGKDRIARLIHAWTPRRRDASLLRVDCGLPEKLLERELFGRGRRDGSPGAGLLERARGGTLLLDEVGRTPLPVQAELVGALEAARLRRARGAGEIAVDVRIVSTTRIGLAEPARAGALRVDLLHRLDVFPICIPPLRERRQDILPLARSFLAELSARAGKSIRELAPETERRLLAHPFPGNVRELRNVIERAVILESRPVLGPDSLELRDAEPASASAAEAFVPIARAAAARPPTLEEVERAYLARLLARAHGNRSQVARWMGVSYPTVVKKIVDYGIDPSRFRSD